MKAYSVTARSGMNGVVLDDRDLVPINLPKFKTGQKTIRHGGSTFRLAGENYKYLIFAHASDEWKRILVPR
jgi:hypothetical protein